MYLSRTTTKIVIVIFFVFLSGYTSLQDGINQDPPPESPTNSKTNWIKTLFARSQFLPNLDFGVKASDEPRIIPGDKIIDKGETVKEKIISGDKTIDKGEKAKDDETMTFSEGMTETAKTTAETTKDKIYQAAINVKETIFPPHDDPSHDEPNHEL